MLGDGLGVGEGLGDGLGVGAVAADGALGPPPMMSQP